MFGPDGAENEGLDSLGVSETQGTCGCSRGLGLRGIHTSAPHRGAGSPSRDRSG